MSAQVEIVGHGEAVLQVVRQQYLQPDTSLGLSWLENSHKIICSIEHLPIHVYIRIHVHIIYVYIYNVCSSSLNPYTLRPSGQV